MQSFKRGHLKLIAHHKPSTEIFTSHEIHMEQDLAHVMGAGTFGCILTMGTEMTSGVYAKPVGLLYHIARNSPILSASRVYSPRSHPHLSSSDPKPLTPSQIPILKTRKSYLPASSPANHISPDHRISLSSLHSRGNTHIRNKSHIAEHRGHNDNVGDGYPCGARGPAEVFVAVGCHV